MEGPLLIIIGTACYVAGVIIFAIKTSKNSK